MDFERGAEFTNSAIRIIPTNCSPSTNLINIIWLGAFFSSDYSTATTVSPSAGIRVDGNNYNRGMKQLWKQLSLRLSASYKLSEQWILNGSAGLYHQLPPYTALGYKTTMDLPQQSIEIYAGNGEQHRRRLASARPYHDFRRGLFKRYNRIPSPAR